MRGKSKGNSESRWAGTRVPVWYKRDKMSPEESILFQVIKEAYYGLMQGGSKEKFIKYYSLPESSIPRGKKGTNADLVGQYCDLSNKIVELLSKFIPEPPAPKGIGQEGDELAETYVKRTY